MLNLRLTLGSFIAKLLVQFRGLKVNCLLTRYPIFWLNPSLRDCIHLARLREHGFQVFATQTKPSMMKAHLIVSDHQKHLTVDSENGPYPLQLRSEYHFSFLLAKVIELAEKDLLEI